MSKFKVGDWVTVSWHKNNNPYKITNIWEGESTKSVNETSNSNSTLFFEDCANRLANQCLPWQPQEGEWCWCVYIDNYDKQHRDLIKWNERMNVLDFDIVEPFIGTLPTFLQGK